MIGLSAASVPARSQKDKPIAVLSHKTPINAAVGSDPLRCHAGQTFQA